jgi:type VI secretion system protein ImpH
MSNEADHGRDERSSATTPARMAVRFLGLTGPQGVLPHVYTEHAAVRARAKDTAFRDFLDLFHHRALSLFYRAWERHRPSVPAERGEEDRLRSHLLDLAGVGTEGVRRHSPLPTSTLAYYAGLLALQSRPALGLAQLVADYFRVAVEAEQFVGEWQPLRHGGQICLGDDDDDGVLGAAVVGNAVYDPQARVRLRIGPLTRAQFDAFLPDGAQHRMLCSLVRMYADDQVGIEAQLVLAQGEVPAAALGVPGTPTLGFGSWLRSKPATHDVDDVRLTLC